MLNKSTFSILMAVLFFVNSLRAMEDPNRDKNLEQGIQKQDSKENESSKTTACSLKDIIVRKLGLEVLSKVDPTAFPEELREYGIQFLINEHCATLEKFKGNKEYAFSEVTEENLNNYKELLYELCENQVEGLDLILTGFGKCWFDAICYRTLYDICEFLKILTKQKNDLDLSTHELFYRDKILDYILATKNVELFKLLLNKRLLPRLDYKINRNNCYVCSFFRNLIHRKSSCFFENVMQQEKNKDYDWKKLFDQEEGFVLGHVQLMPNIMIDAADWFERNIFKALLALTHEKGLLDIINVREMRENGYGLTMLIKAIMGYKVELVELLLNSGADINIKSNSGKTALDYAQERLNEINIKLDKKYLSNDKRQFLECSRLSVCKIIRLLIDYGAVPNLAVDE